MEFLERLKVVALEFSRLTEAQKIILKHWVRNTVDGTIAEKEWKKWSRIMLL